MGQVTSTQHAQAGGHGGSVLTNAQISDNIERLFQSHNTTRLDSVQIRRSTKAMSTSPVEVDTIINGMKGGNTSRVSAIPKRQRYGTVPKAKSAHIGGAANNNQLDSEDLRYVRNMVYQKNMKGGVGSPQKDEADPIVDSSHLFSKQQVPSSSGLGSATSDSSRDILMSQTSDDDPEHHDEHELGHEHDDEHLEMSQTSDVDPDELVSDKEHEDVSQGKPMVSSLDAIKSRLSKLPVEGVTAQSSPGQSVKPKTPLQKADDVVPVLQSAIVSGSPVKSSPSNLADASSKTSPAKGSPSVYGESNLAQGEVQLAKPEDLSMESNLVGGNKSSIDKEIQLIRKMINNTVKQRGGNGDKSDNTDTRVLEDILSEDGLADIRAGLAKHGVLAQQKGGNFDADLKSFRDTILSNQAEVFSATSPDPSNYIAALRGGAKNGAKDDESTNKKKDTKKAKTDDDEEEDELEDEEDDDDEDDDEDADDDEEEDEGDDEEGARDTTSQDGGNQDDDDDEDNSSSSGSGSSSTSSKSSSSTSESDVSDGTITIMHQSINRAMDRKKNTSKYLKDNNYTITSNSDRDYKINNKLVYSSQTSDAHNSVGSEYLSNMRNRDRLA